MPNKTKTKTKKKKKKKMHELDFKEIKFQNAAIGLYNVTIGIPEPGIG